MKPWYIAMLAQEYQNNSPRDKAAFNTHAAVDREAYEFSRRRHAVMYPIVPREKLL